VSRKALVPWTGGQGGSVPAEFLIEQGRRVQGLLDPFLLILLMKQIDTCEAGDVPSHETGRLDNAAP